MPAAVIVVLLAVSAIVIFAVSPKSAAVAPAASVSAALDKSIVSLQAAIAANPSLIKNFFDLSNAYLQKARETADSAYYVKIDGLMDKAAAIDPNNADVPATRSSVAMGRHHFVEGKQFAEDAISKNKNREAYYGLLGDADIELGKYDGAVAAFQKMVDLRPDFSSYSRIAYIRELYGDIPEAKQALGLAIVSGSSFKENVAWAYVELGKLDMRDDLSKAKADFNDALQVLPTYTQAMEGLGKVAFAEGDSQAAIGNFQQALAGLPIAQYSTDLADVYAQLSDAAKRDQNIALTEEAYSVSASSGVDTDLEESLFLSDHGIQQDKALAEAQRAYQVRPSVYAADYLGWAQYQRGNYAEAAKTSKDALRLGDFDPLILFHQGLISLKNGNSALAKKYLSEAYALSPHFSIEYSGILKDTLAQLK